ncbi:chemotaxis protein CheA [Jannaschia seohaensis]|uniref:Chemotaxis protein CheA n=1 Tax=Jannaschia seohaensis TaxID=475081 RepID=A0A2Y9C3S7_9RHOB|nr:chemotaxis protein CheA [Jannaschia seohaensis]PWJ09695.1 two-component system chemotaxis sensor kinase CheA [Jannaschia seohaensis]SSA52012.1 two-component system, chemotaxis family, sensor kinase CheA [Jannaschia seohaensis]
MSASPADIFLQETVEGLESLEQSLLRLEEDGAPQIVDEVFRLLHTIKGSGYMFGFDALARFTHLFENAFERVREGKLALSHGLISTALDARDHMLALLESNSDPAALATLEGSATARDLTHRITEFVDLPAEAAASAQTARAAAAEPVVYTIRYAPDPSSLRNGHRPDLLLDELAALGRTTLIVEGGAVPPLDALEPTACHLSWHIRLETTASLEEVRFVFVFLEPEEYQIETPEPASASTPAVPVPRPEAAATLPPPKSANVRIPAARLDELMDQLGELVIAQTRLDQLAGETDDPAMLAVSEELARLINGLRDSTLAMRMLPIEVVFGKFRRVVRSLADELGKDVALVTTGGDTELDKNVIDSLTEPLVHMIRNAMDHGIETAEARRAAGKPARATVGLAARQSGGEVLISVTDDGRGLDEDAIRARAIERGLLSDSDQPTAAELHQMIFEPAFSTAQQVSSVSGRGVGMDAVRRVVNDLRGSIEIRTQKGAGTVVTLRLPVTLAIIDGLLVRVGDGVFVLPLSSVNECVELAAADERRDSGRTMLRIRDELVPFIRLREIFGIPPSDGPTRRAVIVSAEGRRIGLVVDDVLGQHQTVIKTFSCFHRDIEGFAGSTILGDGRVALIVDVLALIRSVQHSLADTHTIAA